MLTDKVTILDAVMEWVNFANKNTVRWLILWVVKFRANLQRHP